MYSIIIPHKNTTKLLERLLNSIPWTLHPQVIVVDDHSTEAEYKQVVRLSERYIFCLYRSDGIGPGGARNVGLQYATGKWILFADSDDYYMSQADEMIRSHENDDADIVFFNAHSTYSDTGKRAYRDKQIKELIKRYKKNHHDDDVMKCLYTNPWGKMIRRELIQKNDIAFEDIISGEDALFSVLIGLAAHKIIVDEREMYCITVRPHSITSTLDKEHHESNGQARLRVNKYLRENGYGKYQLSVLYYIGMSHLYGWRYMLHALKESCKGGNHPWVGAHKFLHPTIFKGEHYKKSTI